MTDDPQRALEKAFLMWRNSSEGEQTVDTGAVTWADLLKKVTTAYRAGHGDATAAERKRIVAWLRGKASMRGVDLGVKYEIELLADQLEKQG